MKEIRMTPDGKGQVIKTGNVEYSSLGYDHWHRVLKGRNAHEWQSKSWNDTCPKCEKK